MAKMTAEERQKAIDEANAKSKGENTADASKEGPTNDELETEASNEPDAPLSPEAQKAEAELLANLANDSGDYGEAPANPVTDPSFEVPEPPISQQRVAQERHEKAVEKLRLIAMSYPNTTPNEHTVFGFGGHRYELGDLRDLFALPRRG